MTTEQQRQDMEQQAAAVTIEPSDGFTLADVSRMLGKFARLWTGTGSKVDFEKTLKTMRRSLDEDWGQVLLARAEEGNAVGFIYGFANQHDYLEGVFGFERMFYVDPEWRGRGIGRRLLKCFEAWCESKGCRTVIMGRHDFPGDDGKAEQLYLREGYTLAEHSFGKQLT